MKMLKLAITVVALTGCASRSIISEQLLDNSAPIYGSSYGLPRGIIPITIDYKDGTLTVTPPTTIKIYPDPLARYSINVRNSAFSTDIYTIGTSADGLLSTVNATNEDQSPAIIGQVIQLITNVSQAAIQGF